MDCSRVVSLIFMLLWGSVCQAETAGTAVPNIEQNTPEIINEPTDGRMKEKPRVEELGGDIFRIGTIKVDKSKRLITVPGKMLPYGENKPIEFMATMKQGYKAYESVLMLDANAFEFNLACILIGLDSKKAVASEFHFDPKQVEGDKVSINISWEKNNQWVEQDVIDLMKVGGKKPEKPSVWSYTGSSFVEGDRYLAQMDGVLIGLIHDPASVIEHTDGLGLGNWGAILIDPDMAPKGGQDIFLKVRNVE